jgi:carbon monoxide dehydrogenase subunit G
MGFEDVETAGQVPEVLGQRALPGHDGVDEVGVTDVVVGRVPVGPLSEAAEIGGEHHVAPPDQLDGVVAVGGRGLGQTADERFARTVPVGGEDGGTRCRAVVGNQEIGRHRHCLLGVEDDLVAPVPVALHALESLELERDGLGERAREAHRGGPGSAVPPLLEGGGAALIG